MGCIARLPLHRGFYTGERWGQDGTVGVSIRVDAPRRVIPLFVRAGAILPLGPRKQWTEEKVYVSPPTTDAHQTSRGPRRRRRVVGGEVEDKSNNLRATDYDAVELRVYAGADGVFDLYDDDGVSSPGPARASLTIRFTWSDVNRTLTIGRAEVVSPDTGGGGGGGGGGSGGGGGGGGGEGGEIPRLDRMFNLVCVRPGGGHGTGWDVTADADVEVLYSGEEMVVPCDVEDEDDDVVDLLVKKNDATASARGMKIEK
jgi:hypothetical protein